MTRRALRSKTPLRLAQQRQHLQADEVKEIEEARREAWPAQDRILLLLAVAAEMEAPQLGLSNE